MEFMIHALIGLLVVVVWEALGLREACLHLLRKAQRWRHWKRFFDFHGELAIATSMVQVDGEKKAARMADVIVAERLREKLGKGAEIHGLDHTISLSDAREHCIILGSPRYSPHAREIQRYFELPYEYVSEYVQADPPRPVLKIIGHHGQEYIASLDARVRRGPGGFDYGFLFLAALPSGKRVYWLSGIHGPGTIGVAKYLLEHPEQFLDAQPNEKSWSQQWLFRVTHDGRSTESFDMVTSVEMLGGPFPCAPRVIDSQIRAVISDFGNVLMTFDRDRTYRALAHVCHRPYKEIARIIDEAGCRDQYEIGVLNDEDFYQRVCDALDAPNTFTFDSFAEWWGDIFWENRSVIELFSNLEQRPASSSSVEYEPPSFRSG